VDAAVGSRPESAQAGPKTGVRVGRLDSDVRGRGYRGRVKRVAIAGGIGAGKSAVSERLATLGWPVIDADVIARRIVAKGSPAWVALRDAFGSAVLAPDGEIDRPFLADVVFHDDTALRRLNLITHPYIGEEIVRELDATNASLVFVVLPLYQPEHRAIFQLDEVWAVQVEPALALERLCSMRGMSVDDARVRLAAQMSNEDRAVLVDRVIRNDGTLEELHARLDDVLADLGAVHD